MRNHDVKESVRVRYALAAIVATVALSGCGPSAATLRELMAQNPGRAGFSPVRQACAGYESKEECRRAFDGLCGELHRAKLAEAEDAFVRRDLATAASAAASTERECRLPAANELLAGFASKLDRCDRDGTDESCEIQLLLGLLDAPARPHSVDAYLDARRPRLCAHFLGQAERNRNARRAAATTTTPTTRPTTAPTAKKDSPALATRTPDDATSLIDPYLQALRLCSIEQRGALRRDLLAALRRGETEVGQTYATLRSCRRALQADPRDGELASECDTLTSAMGVKVSQQAEAAAEQHLHGLSVRLARAGKDLSTPLSVKAFTLEQWNAEVRALSSWKVGLEFVPQPGTGPLATLLSQAIGADAAFLPPAFSWTNTAMVTRNPPVVARIDIQRPFSVRHRVSQRVGTSRYQTGTKSVPNPEYSERRGACELAQRMYESCVEQRAEDQARAEQCAERASAARARYQECLQAQLQGAVVMCVPALITCPGVRQCSRGSADFTCSLATSTPQYKQEPVYALHEFRIFSEVASASVPVRFDISVGGTSLFGSDFDDSHSEQDEYVEAEPAYNVRADPREIRSDDEIMSILAAKAAERLKAGMSAAKAQVCAELTSRVEAAIKAGKAGQALHTATVLEAAGCSCPATLKTSVDRALDDHLATL